MKYTSSFRRFLVEATSLGFVRRRGECLLWIGLKFGNGYGRLPNPLLKKYGVGRVHRLAFVLQYGWEVLGTKYACHECKPRNCFNPAHLWPGTNQENQLDASRKGSFARYWTKKQRALWSKKKSGEGNPMFGRRGKAAPAYGRTGEKHPMFGKHHTEESKQKTSASLKSYHEKIQQST